MAAPVLTTCAMQRQTESGQHTSHNPIKQHCHIKSQTGEDGSDTISKLLLEVVHISLYKKRTDIDGHRNQTQQTASLSPYWEFAPLCNINIQNHKVMT